MRFRIRKKDIAPFFRNEVCELSILDHNVTLARAGAVAHYVQNVAIFCGGKSLKGVHKDCKMYDPRQDIWSNFSTMLRPREEASIAVAGNLTYVIGGIGDATVEFVDFSKFTYIPTEIIPKSRQKLISSETGTITNC